MPETLAQAGISPQNLRSGMDKVVEATLADPCCQTNPSKVEAFMVRRCLEEVVGRG
jgi:alcohol dehydrogenase class IV